VSGSRRSTATITRSYKPAPDYCARALELLLKKSAIKKGTRPGAPDDPERSSNGRVRTIIPNG
jgi:hypothetical protein